MKALEWLMRVSCENNADRLRFGNAGPNDVQAVVKLLHEASQDKYLDGETLDRSFGDLRNLKKVVVFYYDNQPVGFAIPRRESSGHYRTGPIYTTPSHRGRGIAKAFVHDFFRSKKGRAYIEETNTASTRLFMGVGFRKTGKVIVDGEDRLLGYVKE